MPQSLKPGHAVRDLLRGQVQTLDVFLDLDFQFLLLGRSVDHHRLYGFPSQLFSRLQASEAGDELVLPIDDDRSQLPVVPETLRQPGDIPEIFADPFAYYDRIEWYQHGLPIRIPGNGHTPGYQRVNR